MRQEDRDEALRWGEFYGRESGIQARVNGFVIDTDALLRRANDDGVQKVQQYQKERRVTISNGDATIWAASYAAGFCKGYQMVAPTTPPKPVYRSFDDFATALGEGLIDPSRLIATSEHEYDESGTVVVRNTDGRRVMESDAGSLALELLAKHYAILTED